MSDKFGRHQSTRWVRTSVPLYGNDWNDDYDYGSVSGSEDEQATASPNLDQVKAERFVLDQPNIDESRQNNLILTGNLDTEELSKPPLILSIDNLKDNEIENEEDEDEEGEVVNKSNMQEEEQNMTFSSQARTEIPIQNIVSKDQEEAPISQTLVINTKQDSFYPPTTNYTEPDTPKSETSFQSDSNSIQNEPTNLRMAPRVNDLDIIEGTPTPRLSPEHTNETVEKETTDNLVLSIDNRRFEDSSDLEDDPIPYYEKESHNQEQFDDSGEDEAIDSFINDLQNSSIVDKKNPTYSSDDTDNNSYNYDYDYDNNDDDDDDDEFDNVTPIAPLSIAEEKVYHQKYVKELAGHKPSIRKPPTALSNINTPVVETPLESPTYSDFGDAVDAYMSDRSEGTYGMYDQEGNSTGGQQDPTPQEVPSNSELGPASVRVESESYEALVPPELQLQPITSSGSLSTGKFSLEQKPEFPEPPSISDKDLTRRDSAMSTNTFNFSGWKPNTNNYRDKFINDIDNESNYNFSMDNESITNGAYQKFTKLRHVSTASDAISFASSAPSIPETVDIPLPSINEDPNDDEDDDTFTSNHDTIGEKTEKGLGISTQSKDSVLNDQANSQSNLDEDFSSKEHISEQKAQRYSSLLPPDTDDNMSISLDAPKSPGSESREVSSSIAPTISTPNSRTLSELMSTNSTMTTKTLTRNPYPVSNWKAMMKPSQSIDRINLLREALVNEYAYDSGLQTWLRETLTKSDNSSNMHIGKIASQAYQNATHNDLRRHVSIRSRVSSVRDKVETGGLHASNLGKKFFSRSKKLMRSTN